MDVKCERCGTEYEFEDDRVTENGVTVKCSTCGHLFKIRKKSFVLTEPVVLGNKDDEAQGARAWMIRKGDGTVLSFKELTTLQKWIVERKVSRDDEISKSGETWKRLGSIAELASFFQVVDQATAATGPGLSPAGQATTVPQTPAAMAPGPTTGSMPAAVPPGTPTPAASTDDVPTPSPEAPFVPEPIQPPAPVAAPPAAGAQGEGPSTGQFAGPQQSEPDSWGDGDYASADDDVVEKWKKRGRRKWFVIVPLVLLAAGLGAWYLAAPESFMQVLHSVTGAKEQIPETARARLATGRAHLLRDAAPALDAAAADLNAAIEETGGKFPGALAALAEVHVARADKMVEHIRRIDERIAALDEQIALLMPKDGGEPSAEARKKIAPLHNLKVELQKERLKVQDARGKALDEARRLIDTAGQQAPDDPAPRIAMADYLRVMTGSREQVAGALAAARRAAGAGDPALLFVEGAMLAEDPDRLAEAEEKLRQVVQLQPARIRARYWLARVLAESKQTAEARAQLEVLLATSPDHRQARALLASLEQAPAEQKPDEKPGEKPGAEEGRDESQPSDFEGWMARGDALQKRERYKQALEAFDAALGLKPGNVEALTAKGYCYLDMGMNLAAVRWFGKALESNPRFAAAIMGIAEAYKYHGDTRNAIVYYQKYLDVRPDGPEANIARRNLNDLK